MPYLVLVPYALQLLCIVHIVRTRRPSFWIYILVLLPIGGGLAYLAVELLPSLLGRGNSLAARADIVAQAASPSARLRKLEREVSFSATHENRRLLAEEYLACGEHEKALGVYEALSVGTYGEDPELMMARAKCLYGLGRYAEGLALMTSLDARGYWYRKEGEVVLKLRLLEGAQPDDGKLPQLYAEYDKRFQSFEFAFYYAEYLVRSRRLAEAREVIDRYHAVRRHLDTLRMSYDREWARRLLGMKVPGEEAARANGPATGPAKGPSNEPPAAGG